MRHWVGVSGVGTIGVVLAWSWRGPGVVEGIQALVRLVCGVRIAAVCHKARVLSVLGGIGRVLAVKDHP